MPKFTTQVQYLKYRVLTEVARHTWNCDLSDHLYSIPKEIIPGPKPLHRCCIYKERAIIEQRIEVALGGDRTSNSVVQVLPIACDECPMGGYTVTDSCRGCIAHNCQAACKKNAITILDNHKALIDKTKCVNCGMCATACHFNAIINKKRPCQVACKVNAISSAPTGESVIDETKCISCGACTYQCPFGAIMDKSHITDVIKLIQNSNHNENYHVYVVIAPSLASQYPNVPVTKLCGALKTLGFYQVVEAARGADLVTHYETEELKEKGFLTSSCCPGFVNYIKKMYPTLASHISSNLSPMAMMGKVLKEQDPLAKVIFVGPCVAKKNEAQRENVKPLIDDVLTFEEIQALIDSRDIDMASVEDAEIVSGSYFGRIFARSGGLSEAIKGDIAEEGITDFNFNPIVCSGIDECKLALNKLKAGNLENNFIEGMACCGGCIGGPSSLSHMPALDKLNVDKYSKKNTEQKITDALKK